MHKYIVIALMGISLVTGSYLKGYSAGSNKIQTAWDKEHQETKDKIQSLRDSYYEQEKEYTQKTHDLVLQLQEQEKEHELAITSLNASYNDRLLKSEQRAEVYKRMSCSTSNRGQVLSDYTTRLDKQLTEGIDLVRELRELIKLRDSQLRAIHQQFKLMENKHE